MPVNTVASSHESVRSNPRLEGGYGTLVISTLPVILCFLASGPNPHVAEDKYVFGK